MKKESKDIVIYRYRKLIEPNLIALKNNYINGSLFKRFSNADQGEMNYGFTEEFKKKNNVSDKDAKIYVDAIIDNSKENYYLACFTLNKPARDSAEWEKYANKTGYCLSYSVKEIANCVYKENQIKNRILMFDKVQYSNDIFSLDPIAEEMIRLCKIYDLHTLDDLNRNENKIMKANNKIGAYAVKAFFHKSDRYSKYNEVRLVELVQNQNNSMFKDCLLKVKPLSIIIRKGFPLNCYILEEISRNNCIPIQYI